MPAVVQTQTINSASLMFKERHEPIVSSFTAVNGRTSPPFAPNNKPTAVNGSSADPVPVRPYSHAPPDAVRDQKPPPGLEWKSVPRAHESGPYTVSPSLDTSDRSPQSPPKRKRSGSGEGGPSFASSEGAPDHSRRRLEPFTSPGHSPPASFNPVNMEQASRTLPPIHTHVELDKPWPSREGHHPDQQMSHYRETQDPNPIPGPSHLNGVEHPHHQAERSGNMEITRAGAQVDPKKRKRQFANRTKTGCATCRRRKKKCDEGKPECNNCSRGGFYCEGYATKVQYPRNGLSKSHPPLQAKDSYALEQAPPSLFHNHGAPRETYAGTSSSDGARARPIVVEEHERQDPRSSWGNWRDHPRPPHVPDHSRAQEFHPPQPTHGGPQPPRPGEPYTQRPSPQEPPSQRQQGVYHAPPQTMAQVHTSPDVPAEHRVHHQAPPPAAHAASHQGPSTGLQGPPHYTPAPPLRREKSERDKMLSGEAFVPYHPTLLIEREHCSGAVYRFNSTSNMKVQITRVERFRHFQSIVNAKWICPDIDGQYRGSVANVVGHAGSEVHVDTPFHCDYGYNLMIDDMVTIGPGCKFLDSGRISVGRNARIGANVTIDTQQVPTDSKSVKGSRGTVVAAEVSIGENVYIGAGATILAGVKIGTGAIIHPGSVVTKDVPRDCVARGNPANVQKVFWSEED